MRFPFYIQYDAADCGPACLRILLKYYGIEYPIQHLRTLTLKSKDGVSMLALKKAGEALGFNCLAVRANMTEIKQEVPLPCIIHWENRHYIIVYKIKGKYVYLADPATGLRKVLQQEFESGWIPAFAPEKKGIALILEPTPRLFEKEQPDKKKQIRIVDILKLIFFHRTQITQIFIGLAFGTLLQLIFPFLAQSIIDIGIGSADIAFINLVLIGQMVLVSSQVSVNFIRSWIMLNISTKVNITLISAFLNKMFKLSIRFFETRIVGDILTRIADHHRIEQFLVASSVSMIYSILTFIVFSVVILTYSAKIFFIFMMFSILHTGWIFIFLRRRKDIDYEKFTLTARNQSLIFHLVKGIYDIKLNNAQRSKQTEWELLQSKVFKANINSLTVDQVQQSGAMLINEVKNMVITFLAANAVIKGEITLGMLLSIQYIIGQLNGPINMLIGFIQQGQEANISFNRLNDIYMEEEEKEAAGVTAQNPDYLTGQPIRFSQVSFAYDGHNHVLTDLNFTIPAFKTTALVGGSGSGKSSILKLLMRFYEPNQGEILVNDYNLGNLDVSSWRENIGAVMQGGFIFSDSVEKNIALGFDIVDQEHLDEVCKIANLADLIAKWPMGYQTKIGEEGMGISEGQKQRILIARALYKKPKILLFDEATNSLDAENEFDIINNINSMHGKCTIIIVAHRLNTIFNADQIIVMDNGRIVESGVHAALLQNRGQYFNLVKKQLTGAI